jgi:hypothetical protein
MRHVLIAIAIAGCGGSSGGSITLTREEIAQACVNAYACLAPPIDGPTLPGCLRKLDDDDGLVSMYRPEQVRCLAEAGADCTRARACIGYTFGACSPDTVHCEGDHLVDCVNGSGFSVDCRSGLWFSGETCVANPAPICGLGPCTDGTPDRCDGTRVVHCSSGVLQSGDCARYGDTCIIDNGRATCAGPGATCTASRCEGTRLIRCTAGHEVRYACDAILAGGTCVPIGRDGASCAFDTACVESATCTGNVTQVCVLGTQVTIDCVATGFQSCYLGSCIPSTFP